MKALRRFIGPGALLAALSLAAGCGGGGGGSSSGTGDVSTQSDGTVAVLVTDAPTDVYDQILVTITRISLLPGEDSGADEAVVLYEDAEGETLDLLQLSDHAELFAVQEEVAVGDYAKVRLEVSGVELVDEDTTPETRVAAKLPSGWIDLLPREPLEVSEDQTLYLELDIDAAESVLVVETGSGTTVFRPVVFVATYEEGEEATTDGDDGTGTEQAAEDAPPLISVSGLVRIGDEDEVRICPSGNASLNACVRPPLDEVPVFDSTGALVDAASVEAGDRAIAQGPLERDDDGRRVLDTLSLALGTRPTLGTRGGAAAGPVDAEGLLTTRSGRTIRLHEQTPVVDPHGTPQDRAGIDDGQPLTVFGIVSEEPIAATLLVLGDGHGEEGAEGEGAGGEPAAPQEVLRGELVSVDTADTLQMDVDGVTEPVRLVENGTLVVSGEGRMEETDLAALDGYDRVRLIARGVAGTSYFEAERIVAVTLGRDDQVQDDGPPDHAGPPGGSGPPGQQ